MVVLTDKCALVTGGGTGIGAEIAVKLSALGAKVVLAGRREQPLLEMASRLNNAEVVTMDVADEGSVAQAFSGLGKIDILVNNAGLAKSAPFKKMSLGLWNQTLAVNLTGTYLCSAYALQSGMDKEYGRIINIASTASLTGYAYVSAYCAAKHGVLGLTRSLAKELASTGITVNAICPGYTETDILSDTIENIRQKTGCSEEKARAQLTSSNPQKRFIQPQEVANTVAWLCDPLSNSVNGQAIAVDGGETA